MKQFRSLLCIALLAILIGCGTDEPDKTKESAEEQMKLSGDTAILSEEDKLKASMTELIERMIEGDKTVLYEHEFSYYTDETSLSDYMKLHRVIDYNYDTLRGITYDSVKIMGDSAIVDAGIIYESKAGGEFTKKYRFKMYNFHGKWVKPYMSQVRLEREYLEQQRIYDSAAAAEEAEAAGN
ncbi:MAG: hypothetical protein DRP51_06740 [Candidatus Zixiibacteriota bacterium]|nr:MAG: hypothetical protein DRP51_06740 [candidate division Zixibacteria bacterium]HHI02629.1 hypothetical protein [candidate division Zixibacteria bacterium]